MYKIGAQRFHGLSQDALQNWAHFRLHDRLHDFGAIVAHNSEGFISEQSSFWELIENGAPFGITEQLFQAEFKLSPDGLMTFRDQTSKLSSMFAFRLFCLSKATHIGTLAGQSSTEGMTKRG
jgi:hypothetical protein